MKLLADSTKTMFFIVLMAYDPDYYTKEVHEAVLAEEEAERQEKLKKKKYSKL